MSKTIKIFFIFLIVSFIVMLMPKVYASDINMNLMPNDTSLENSEEIIDSADELETITDDLDTSVPAIGTGVAAEDGLSLSNILSILLITVGIVLILLAIAIIMRLR